MTVKSSMESYAARLASFDATYPATKKRASDPKGKRTLRWPHQKPSPPQLARAGFFYRPSSSSPDNTTCYLCESSLDGWEENDDAVVEHLKHAPECGWAVTIAIEQDVESGSYSLEDLTSERIVAARRMTFGSKWPHESKKGWVCKIKKMVEAGWHYCPTMESDDFVKCSYCQLSLDGWEPKDKPLDEHRRRSPDCPFFTLYASIKSASAGPKKSRASRTSRNSTQSNFTVASEGLSVIELETNPDESMPSAAESVKPTKPVRGGKKATRSKNAGSKAKGKAAKTKEEESHIASSFLEPEDDDFEVKVASSSVNSKKRKSEDISIMENTRANDVETELPPTKRRNTRSRTSVAQALGTSISAPFHEEPADAHMTDAEEIPPPSAPSSKKKGKSGKKRASSRSRKVSTASVASKASLRANVPNDEDIDAALEADLARPLTDDEADVENREMEQPKGRRLTRSKPAPVKATASVAPTRRGTRASSMTVNEPAMTDVHHSTEVAIDDTSKSPIANASRDLQDDEAITLPSPKTKKSTANGSRKAKVQQKSRASDTKSSEEISEESVEIDSEVPPHMEAPISESRQPKGRTLSPQQVTHDMPAPSMPDTRDVMDLASEAQGSVPDTQTLQDDSGHETDFGGPKKARTKRASKKPSGPKKKAKGSKKVAAESRDAIGVFQAPVDESQLKDTDNKPAVAPENMDFASANPEETVLSDEGVKPMKASKASKTKGKAAKTKIAAQTAQVAPSPEQPTTVIEIQDTPASRPQSSVHVTPQKAMSPQSSDAENQPPSSRPAITRPPLSPFKSQVTIIPLAATTPISSPSKVSASKLHSTLPWTAVDIGEIFSNTPGDDKENDPFILAKASGSAETELTSPEKKLTVEQWIHFNAQRGEEKLRNECERIVGKFEDEGVRALRTLEGIVCTA